MKELDKLMEEIIELFDSEVYATVYYESATLEGRKEFFEGLNKILASRPTCGEEQRLFLDKIEKEQKRPMNKNCDFLEMIIEWLRLPAANNSQERANAP